MSVLVVDDTVEVRQAIVAMLKSACYKDIATVSSAVEALAFLGIPDKLHEPCSVELVLMDVNMPGIDGLEGCRRIKAAPERKDIPVIVLTGNRDPGILQASFTAGASDYLAKPPHPLELLARVKSALGLKREMDHRKLAHISDLENKNRELEVAYRQLEAKNRELEEASIAKTQILSTATHELKTPLTSM
ncbi:MAG: response regulator [SAR202 cluster bacterium]|nr:response regulator [SAR202 cluster bacterium]